ncbi:hypothetical protein [Caldinitratiruptor microaerophilus]|uniref:Uncharacterized protein n=1 Tax=Caldinitratiruptor microaerophilus TaxID=671077 RepID=A0AA35CLR8_9FIRM|nr:hypothetical protein [Caldinitratiruptor microaerophilus]BDG60733.1 hypothetical protein caldi_18230 [Caldinitratiruptor microaerophilus]
MRLAAVIAGDPVSVLFFLEEDPDSLGCWLRVQQVTEQGTADAWERYFPSIPAALEELERDWGLDQHFWVDLEAG